MMIARIGLYQGKSFFPSKMIRWFTWSKYSHAAFLCDDGSVYESWHVGGVCHRKNIHEGHTPGTKIDVFYMAVSELQYFTILESLRREVGKKYDFKGILGMLLRKNVDKKASWFCSELVFKAFKDAGIDLLANKKPEQVSPADLSFSPLLTKLEHQLRT